MSNHEYSRKAHLVGGGIAGLAAAAYLIKDGGLLPANISIYEERDVMGGCLDAAALADQGYSMRGERMFEPHFACAYDLWSSIPSLADPTKSIKQDIFEFVDEYHWNNKARLVDKDGKVTDFHHFGFDEHDRLALIKLTSEPEDVVDGKRITDVLPEHFFNTNFWYMWATTFGFQPWHSAIEMRRYLLRFMHLFSVMPTQSGLYRTRYNQYDSIVRPMEKFLGDQGVRFVGKTVVHDIDIGSDPDVVTATRILMTQDGKAKEIAVGPDDIVLATIGSLVADSSLGTNTSAPQLITTPQTGAFRLWHTLAKGRKDLGDPSVFTDHIEETNWESYTVTTKDPLFFEKMEKLCSNEAGRNGMVSLKDSPWLITLSLYHQPQFLGQPEDVMVWWGYGLYPDKIGDYVKKPMSECSGAEILEESLRQLKWDDADVKRIVDSSITIPCKMPYIVSEFVRRKKGDRPDVVPKGSTNFGLLGQFVEVPVQDTVFTVEYSVRTAQTAVYKLLNLDKQPNAFVNNLHDVDTVWKAMKAMHQ